MNWNDYNDSRLQLTKNYIDKIRTDKDQVGIVKFISVATIVSNLSNNKDELKSAVDSITNDNGYNAESGTNSSAGLKTAIELLKSSTAANKYVMLLSDGEDTHFSYDYDLLIKEADDNEIKIICVGMAMKNEEDDLIPVKTPLQSAAEMTDGEYYETFAGESVEAIFDDVEEKTIDLTTDSNNDGICDYYSQRLHDGTLLISNSSAEFKGIDFTYGFNNKLCDDLDGDGLKNGDEILIKETKYGQVYVEVITNPLFKDSDYDGISDRDEVQYGSDPMSFSYKKENVDYLLGDYNFHPTFVKQERENFFSDALFNISAFVTGINGIELYRDIILDYLMNYTQEENIYFMEYQSWLRYYMQTLQATTKAIQFTDDIVNSNRNTLINQSVELINKASELTNNGEIINYAEIIDELTRKYNLLINRMKINGIEEKYIGFNLPFINKRKVNVGSIDNALEKMSTAYNLLVLGADVMDTILDFANIESNVTLFEQSTEILNSLCYSDNEDIVYAAREILDKLNEKYYGYVEALLFDVTENFSAYAVGELAANNIYVFAVVGTIAAFNAATGFAEDMNSVFGMFCYHELAIAYRKNFKWKTTETENYYNSLSGAGYGFMIERTYLLHLAQTRILSEWAYNVKMLFDEKRNSQIDAQVEIICKKILNVHAKELGLVLHQIFYDEYN